MFSVDVATVWRERRSTVEAVSMRAGLLRSWSGVAKLSILVALGATCAQEAFWRPSIQYHKNGEHVCAPWCPMSFCTFAEKRESAKE